MPESEARLRASKKYHQKFQLIQIRVLPEEKETVILHAAEQKESVNSFVRRAISETIARDRAQKGSAQK